MILISLRKIMLQRLGSIWNYYSWFILFVPWLLAWCPFYFWTKPALLVFLALHKLYVFIKPNNFMIHFPNEYHLIAAGYTNFILFAKWIFAVWLSGALLGLGYVICQHFQFLYKLKMHSRPLNQHEKTLIRPSLAHLQQKYISSIYLSEIIVSPMICHVINSKIYLPQSFFNDYTITEQKYVLQHEFFHYKRRDILANSLMLLLVCLNWFNPLMYYGYRYFRHTQELSCDAMVGKNYTMDEKKQYGLALIKTVTQSIEKTSAHCWWNAGIELKERCLMLKYHQFGVGKALASVFLMLTCILSMITAIRFENSDVLFFYLASTAKDSNYLIKIFNNADTDKNLHYKIITQDQRTLAGNLGYGDYQGEFFPIKGQNVELQIDKQGKILTRVKIQFRDGVFSSQLIQLDKQYKLSMSHIHQPQIMAFDITKKS